MSLNDVEETLDLSNANSLYETEIRLHGVLKILLTEYGSIWDVAHQQFHNNQ